ncbi:MAG: hypothetical protein IT426_20745 [Pirellulales bacterium]|nr:hypothetical protein [Pirellulales bacterium]
MDNTNGLTIEAVPVGKNGSATLTVKVGGDVLAVEKLDLTKPKARQEFTKRLCENRKGIDSKELESKLLILAAGVVGKPESKNPTSSDAISEIDVSYLARPERFITHDVSGLVVPIMSIMDDKPFGRWILYLRWADGKREQRPMVPALDLPNNKKLWIYPEPSEPPANMLPGWSQAARKTWLAGSHAPNPSELFKRLCQRIEYFLDLPKRQAPGMASTLALWTMLSYCFQNLGAVPYLYLGGPTGSGKSRVIEILSRLVFRSVSSSNMTGPALFRTLHSYGGILLLDEAERLKQSNDPSMGEILSMLLAGYKRGGKATRLEPIGENGFKTVHFDVFGPKALACIAGLPPALASRCITMMMFRSPPGSEKPQRGIDADPAAWQSLRDDLHALAMEHGAVWLELPRNVEVCPKMSGRDFELWQPILALAAWIESHGARGLLKLLQEHALAVIDAGRDDSTPDTDETLLKILVEKIRCGHAPTPGEILAKAQELDSASFIKWSPKGISERLKRYGLATHRSCGRKIYGRITPDDLRRVQECYGVDLELDENTEEV